LAALGAGKNPRTGKPSNPSIEKLEAIAKGMNISIDELLDMMGEKRKKPLIPSPRVETFFDDPSGLAAHLLNAYKYTPGIQVPIVGTVRCGPGGLAFEDLQGAALAEVSNPSEYFHMRVEGNSMEPDIKAGDLVLVHIQPEVESGELAVIIIDGEEGMLKKYTKKDNAIILQSFNQAYPPRVFVGEEMNLVHVAGKVVESKRKW
jgi:SOS-response transcriptional repressor LexA